MPLLPHTPQVIKLPIADRQQGDTLIRQMAQFQSLTHLQDANGQCSARILVVVTMYAADGDGYGPALTGPGFSTYTAELVADNNWLVDASTGALLAGRQGANPTAWQATIDSFEQPTMLQGDFFEYLRENQEINIGQMIRQHIQQADSMGRFA